eukprot:4006969-Pyramimonas_sp.AAC.1
MDIWAWIAAEIVVIRRFGISVEIDVASIASKIVAQIAAGMLWLDLGRGFRTQPTQPVVASSSSSSSSTSS